MRHINLNMRYQDEVLSPQMLLKRRIKEASSYRHVAMGWHGVVNATPGGSRTYGTLVCQITHRTQGSAIQISGVLLRLKPR